MENNKDQLLKFIENHAVFFDTWSNWVIILLFILTIVVLFLLIARVNAMALKILVFLFLLLPLLILIFFTWLLNSPLKPFISSVAIVQKTLNAQPPDSGFVNVKDHKTYRLSDFRGKVVVLNFWGTYCNPCVEELIDLKKLEEADSAKVVVIALSEEPADTIVSFLEKHESPSIVGSFPGTGWIDLQTFKPLTLFIDKNGIAREYIFGRKDFNFFSDRVNAFRDGIF